MTADEVFDLCNERRDLGFDYIELTSHQYRQIGGVLGCSVVLAADATIMGLRVKWIKPYDWARDMELVA